MPSLFVVKNPGLITASSIGLALEPTLDASGGLESADETGAAYLKHNTGVQVGSGGLISSFDAVQLQLLDEVAVEVKLDPTLFLPNANYGYWIGLFSVRPVIVGTATTDPTTGDWAAFRILENGGVQTITRNGASGMTTRKPASTPSNITAGSVQTFRIKAVNLAGNPPKLEFFWTGASQSPYTTHDGGAGEHLPAPASPMAFGAFIITSAAVNRHLRWKVVELKLK
jgi:hypothetical protein